MPHIHTCTCDVFQSIFRLHRDAELYSSRHSIHKQLTCDDVNIPSLMVVQNLRFSQRCCCLPGHRNVWPGNSYRRFGGPGIPTRLVTPIRTSLEHSSSVLPTYWTSHVDTSRCYQLTCQSAAHHHHFTGSPLHHPCLYTTTYPYILECTWQWRTQEFFSGGSTNSVEDRGQRERGSGGGSNLVRGSGGSCNLVQEI